MRATIIACFVAALGTPVNSFMGPFRAIRPTVTSRESTPLEDIFPERVGKGLLTGVEVSDANYYTDNMSIQNGANIAKDANYVYNIAVSTFDGDKALAIEHLKEIAKKAKEYSMVDKKFWDREILSSKLEEMMSSSGNFICILGSKSTGKSRMLTELKNKKTESVAFIDLRDNPDLFSGLFTALNLIDSNKLQDLLNSLPFSIKLTAKNKNFKLEMSEKINSPQQILSLLELLKKVFDYFNDKNAFTIIVDEANLVFDINEKTTEEIKFIKQILAMFVTQTKAKKKLNVILVSSDHSFPYHLSDKRLGFNLLDIETYVYISDISPRDMFRLLTKEWGVKEQIAEALISIYGGNIHFLTQALKQAVIMYDSPKYKLNAEFYVCVQECLRMYDNQDRMRQMLRTLSEKGFVLLDDRADPVAETISLCNVGGVVVSSGLNTGLPDEVWGDDEIKFGLVPAGQSMRLVIAQILNKLD